MFPRFLGLDPSDKTVDVWKIAPESRASLFETEPNKIAPDINGTRSEVIEVPRDEDELFARFNNVAGLFAVPPVGFFPRASLRIEGRRSTLHA